MNIPGGLSVRQLGVAEAIRWVASEMLVIGIRLGALVWMLRADPVVIGDGAPPAAIMIEFDEAPQATDTEMNEVTPDLQSAEQAVAQVEQKHEEPEKNPPDPPAPEPLKPVDEEVVEERPSPVEKVEVPLPVAQPKRERPLPRSQPASRQSRAAMQAAAQVRQSTVTAARQTTSGLSSVSPANWQSRLMAHLEQRKRYPAGARARNERGIAYARFTIDDAGNVLSVALARSSGFSELDQEVLSLVRRASPVPALPPGVNRTITASVRFNTQ